MSSIGRVQLWLAAALAASCGAREAKVADDAAALREEARGILARRCGGCHLGHRRTALPRALAVFDLDECDWQRRMDERQLRNALWRLGEPLPPDGRANDVPDAERAAFGRFVEAESRRRSGGRPGPAR